MNDRQRQIVAEIEALDKLPKRSLTEELIEKRQHLLALLRIEGDLHLLPKKLRLEAMETQAQIELLPRKFRNQALTHDYAHDLIEDEREDLNDPDRIKARKLAHKIAVIEREQRIRELRAGDNKAFFIFLIVLVLLGVGTIIAAKIKQNGILHRASIAQTNQPRPLTTEEFKKIFDSLPDTDECPPPPNSSFAQVARCLR